jgi:hypothetical protein
MEQRMGVLGNPKVTMQFTYGTTGWSESHYYFSAVSVTNTALYNNALALIESRVRALDGEYGVVTQVKFSQDNINRDVGYLLTSDLPQPTNKQYSGGPSSAVATWNWQSPHLSWPIKLQDENNNQLAISYIAGMPAQYQQTGPSPYNVASNTPPGFFLSQYAEYLIGGVWGTASRTWPSDTLTAANSTVMTAPVTYTPATGFTPPSLTFTVAQAGIGGPIVPGGYIRVGGLKYVAAQNRLRLNGTYLVATYAAGLATVYVPRLHAAPQFNSLGWVQAATTTFSAYDDYVLDNQTHRKRGRVIAQPRGRRAS